MRFWNLLPQALRHRLIRSRVQMDERLLSKVDCSLVESPGEALEAARLVYAAYDKRGLYDKQAPAPLHVTPYSVLPSTLTFVARHERRVIGTISLVMDSPLGLPSERVYKDEIGAMRHSGMRLAEVGSLALAPEWRKSGVVHLLNYLQFETSRRLGFDRAIASVHPSAEELYAATVLYERAGQERAYPGLNRSARAVLITQRIQEMPDAFRRTFSSMPKVPGNSHYLYCERPLPQVRVPEGVLQERAWSFRQDMGVDLVHARRDVFRGLPAVTLSHLKRLLPGVLWPGASLVDREEANVVAGAPAYA